MDQGDELSAGGRQSLDDWNIFVGRQPARVENQQFVALAKRDRRMRLLRCEIRREPAVFDHHRQ